MESLSLLTVIYPKFIVFSLIFTRLIAFFYSFTLFRREMATMRLLISLAMILSCYVMMLTKPVEISEDILSIPYVMHSVVQVILGLTCGIIMNIFLEVFSAVGQIVSVQIGLSAASLFDPKFGVITSLTNFYVIIGSILFFEMNGHLILIKTLVQSFSALPVTVLLSQFYGASIAHFSSIIFSGSVLISLTVITAILMTNLAMAFVSKFAPQFNLFSIGLNVSILIGLVCVYLTFQMLIDHGQLIIDSVLTFFKQYLIGLSRHG